MPEGRLKERIEEIATAAGAHAVAISFHDYGSGESFSHGGDQPFHAASTIKLPVLIGVFDAIERGAFTPEARLHVRNRFVSVADGRLYRVGPERDGGTEVHGQIGKTMRIIDLARQMIVTSSNLATNLLVDLVGVGALRATIERLGLEGIDLHRGVEDERAFDAGINNMVTADALVRTLRAIEEGALHEASTEGMLEILHDQRYRSGIPAGVPDSVRVANKTGEISTAVHDAGLVYPDEHEPYALSILTEWEGSGGSRRELLADLSRTVYRHLVEGGEDA